MAARLGIARLPILTRCICAARNLTTRPFARRDAERLRRVLDGKFVGPSANPGVRIEPDFVTEAEAELLVAEARGIAAAYGYDYDGDKRAHMLNPADGAIEETANWVNNTRVTGRLEKPKIQKLPPWGYGDAFDETQLPPGIHGLVAKIRKSGSYGVGKVRDVTMNLRHHSFFQLDPHLDPRDDGPHVFVLSLLSSVVTTFSPSEAMLTASGMGPRRRKASDVGLRSWSDQDIDAICLPRTLLHFSGDARSSWMHAIRPGVHVDLPTGGSAVCDWWGKPDYLVRRNSERISIVVAFGAGIDGSADNG